MNLAGSYPLGRGPATLALQAGWMILTRIPADDAGLGVFMYTGTAGIIPSGGSKGTGEPA